MHRNPSVIEMALFMYAVNEVSAVMQKQIEVAPRTSDDVTKSRPQSLRL